MKKIKAMTIFGTRPEAIKMAPLVKKMDASPYIENKVLVTAQHREMLDQVLQIFDIRPDFDLDIMKSRQTLVDITTSALSGISGILADERPDIVLVHGDTTTTFAGALAAFYNKISSAHVEAGLRTYDKYQPYPEEMNRCMTGRLCDLHFAPTAVSKGNLLRENVPEKSIFVTGNTVIDALSHTIEKGYSFRCESLNSLDFKNRRVIAVTAHRRENLGKPLEDICLAIRDITLAYPDVEIVYAVHKNPKVRDTVFDILGGRERIHLTEPLDLKDMHNLMNNSFLVLTDSGGLQEEVPSMGKPVLVLRNVTERPEGIAAGTLKLVGTKREDIFEKTALLLNDRKEYEKMASSVNPFGDGRASERIVDAMLYYFGIKPERPEDYEYPGL